MKGSNNVKWKLIMNFRTCFISLALQFIHAVSAEDKYLLWDHICIIFHRVSCFFIHIFVKKILPFCHWILLSRNRNTAESLKSNAQLLLIKSSWHGDSLCPSCASINSSIERPASAIFDCRCFSPLSLILGFTPVGSQHLLSLDFLFLAQQGRGTVWGVVDNVGKSWSRAWGQRAQGGYEGMPCQRYPWKWLKW